jgi:hypothetical protein
LRTDFRLNFDITDPTIGTAQAVPVTFFKRNEDQLPDCAPGDVIVINNVRCKGKTFSFKTFISNHSTHFQLLKAEDFKNSKELVSNLLSSDVKVYVKHLAQWATKQLGSLQDKPAVTISKPSNSSGSGTQLSQLKADTFNNLCGEVVRVWRNSSCVSLYITDYTTNPLFYQYVEKDNEDETERVDDYRIPLGQMTLQVTLFGIQYDWVLSQNNLVGEIVSLKNVHTKYNQYGSAAQLEGALHDDHMYRDKILVAILGSSNPIRQEILERKKAHNAEITKTNLGRFPGGETSGQLSKAAKKKPNKERKRLERVEAEKRKKELEATGVAESLLKTPEVNKRSKTTSSFSSLLTC